MTHSSTVFLRCRGSLQNNVGKITPLPFGRWFSTHYPTHPRVGIAATIVDPDTSKVLIIERATQPAKGLLSLPGGRLELGEKITDAAAREVLEETNVHVRTDQNTVAKS